MKRYFAVLMMCCFLFVFSNRTYAQAEELIQLTLNIEKLAQLKSILTNLYKGYTILEGGYTKIRDIANGNYSLHQVFLDGLYAVSPAVKKYRRIPDIISNQASLVSEYQSAFRLCRQSGIFNSRDLDYMAKVYEQLLKESASNLDELIMVVTSGQMRMSDDERITAIDRIYSTVEDKLVFLRDFNSSVRLLALQKQKEKTDLDALKGVYGLP